MRQPLVVIDSSGEPVWQEDCRVAFRVHVTLMLLSAAFCFSVSALL